MLYDFYWRGGLDISGGVKTEYCTILAQVRTAHQHKPDYIKVQNCNIRIFEIEEGTIATSEWMTTRVYGKISAQLRKPYLSDCGEEEKRTNSPNDSRNTFKKEKCFPLAQFCRITTEFGTVNEVPSSYGLVCFLKTQVICGSVQNMNKVT